MIKPQTFYEYLIQKKIDHFYGVPDSLLKNICGYIQDNTNSNEHIITANEGNAIAIASGYHLATNKMALVYFQNSGLGNTINPLVSLADKNVYSIPMLLMIGWRGEPNLKDEPQHIRQGEITLELLETLRIPYEIIDENHYEEQMDQLIELASTQSQPVAMIIRKGLFNDYAMHQDKEAYPLSREEALEVVLDSISSESVIVSTTGKSSREIYEIREKKHQGHHQDFLTVGSMGHASSIALGLSLNTTKNVYCIDGDGALLMHMGSMAILANNAGDNLKYILINNESHESVGGQATVISNIDLKNLFTSLGFNRCQIVSSKKELTTALKDFHQNKGQALVINVNKNSRKDLGRPKTTPIQNKEFFKKNFFIHE